MSREDARKAEYMRYAQMFAKFGSTPGPVLRAVVLAINDTVPDLIEDQKKASDIQREANKVLSDLNKSELLEKQNRANDALKAHNDAAKTLTQLSTELGTTLFKAEVDKLQIKGQLAKSEAEGISGERREHIQGKYLVEGKRIDAGATMAANERRIKADEKKDQRELDKRIDTQTKNARAEYNAYMSNKERVAEKQKLNRDLTNAKPGTKIRIAAEKRLEEMKREEQKYIRDLPKSYELAKIDDLIQESNADSGTSPYSPEVQAALDKYK